MACVTGAAVAELLSEVAASNSSETTTSGVRRRKRECRFVGGEEGSGGELLLVNVVLICSAQILDEEGSDEDDAEDDDAEKEVEEAVVGRSSPAVTPPRLHSGTRPRAPSESSSANSRPRKRRRGTASQRPTLETTDSWNNAGARQSEPLDAQGRFEKDLISELTCEICFMLLYRPVTTPCQHVRRKTYHVDSCY